MLLSWPFYNKYNCFHIVQTLKHNFKNCKTRKTKFSRYDSRNKNAWHFYFNSISFRCDVIYERPLLLVNLFSFRRWKTFWQIFLTYSMTETTTDRSRLTWSRQKKIFFHFLNNQKKPFFFWKMKSGKCKWHVFTTILILLLLLLYLLSIDFPIISITVK